ncbi:MAG: 4-hydroxy-3-methylbut-2-enyl diphosphate reductase [Clostridia bacterium]|nr:4-hydroxy-3-methylbut-2-enyl diphosphate reductase [Clostridia bacterium]
MKVIIGKNSGFCFGVKRAVDEAFSLKGERKFVLGEIIHNESVINKLSDRGIITIDSLDDERFIEGDVLLIRTHGESKTVFDKAKVLGLKIVDCTCPFVKDIQKKVHEHYNKGYQIIIIGNQTHPEIKGINGWCDNSAIITEDCENLPKISADKVCVVVQTTFSEQKFNNIIKNFAFKDLKSVDIFKTICYTTSNRQKEADYISKKCQAVLVLGGANSNNTDNLFKICQKNCNAVYRLINPTDFDYETIKNYKRVGIVLGASTPIEQFQEVISNMEKVTKDTIETEVIASEETVAEVPAQAEEKKSEMELAFNNIKPSRDFRVGQIITAVISSVKEEGLTLSIKDAKKDDFDLNKSEILADYNPENYKAGDKIRVMVVGKNPLKFSEKAMEKVLKEESDIEEIKNGKIFEAVIDSANKGGLIGKYGNYQVFVPSSQIVIGFVKDLNKFVGKTLRLKAEKVESKGARRQIVGSQRVILEAEKQERDAIKAEKEAEFFGSIQEGDVVLGTPVRFANFGAFIDVNGFDCLAHISDLSWTRCENCADVLEIGKEYEFKILKIDVENKRVSVGYKQLQQKPWDIVAEKYAVGDVVKGNVVRLVNFGAFVEIEKGVDGLIHVSNISNKYLENPATALQVGQEVEAKIIDINFEKEKINLSIKALLPEEPAEVEEPKKSSKKREAKKEEAQDEEPHSWSEDDGSVSIAEMIKTSEN